MKDCVCKFNNWCSQYKKCLKEEAKKGAYEMTAIYESVSCPFKSLSGIIKSWEYIEHVSKRKKRYKLRFIGISMN